MAIKPLAIAVALLMSTNVFAATAISSVASAVAVEEKAIPSNSTSIGQQLTEANNRIQLLTAQLKAAELKAQIAEKNSKLMGAAASNEDPYVRSIEGLNSRLSATLSLANGTKIRVSAGDTLPNGMKVKSISDREVVLSKGKSIKRLPVMSASGEISGYSASQAGINRPGAPIPIQ